MRVKQYSLVMSGKSAHVKERSTQERLRVWSGERAGTADGRTAPVTRASETAARVNISNEARQLNRAPRPGPAGIAPSGAPRSARATTKHRAGKEEGYSRASPLAPRLEIMRLILEKMTGRTFKVVSSEELSNREEGESPSSVPPPPPTTEGAAPARVGWGVEYERREVEYEAQVAQFSSAGVVETADGRTLNFNINLEMSRERLEVSEFRLFAGDARPQLVDPLVINFDGTAAELTEDTHSFDLDADGRAERIAFVRNGSGFLALDMNENGVIDNGTELFGPTTGDGFAELARHDEDGNGWIDEADAAYDKLRVWTQSEGGDKQLETLAAKNVGAIYLGQVATPFELRNDQNETQGVIQSTGIYLSEDGRAGTVQHVDLATTAQPREEGDAAATRTSAVADAPITQPPPPPETPLPE